MRLVLIGNPESPRTAFLRAALSRRAETWELQVVPWVEWLSGAVDLRSVVREGDVVRIDSPGRNFEVERALLRRGFALMSAEKFVAASLEELDSLQEEKGQIRWPRQWYLGFCDALEEIQARLGQCAEHRLVTSPAEVGVMFDKTLCSEALRAAGVPVPTSLGEIEGWDDLVMRMGRAGMRQVFVKLAHGSSASGAIAYRTDGRGRHHAVTTVECGASRGGDAETRLYNTRRLRRLEDVSEIARLIDAVCRHKAHAERWMPKATTASGGGGAFDLRVVVIGGRSRQVVVRVSRSPMTNLHLLNQRGDVRAVRGWMGATAWQAAMQSCERAMSVFPGSLCGGVDLLVGSDPRRHAVLEVNAFGDLLPGVVDEDGMDSYEAEVAAMERQAGSLMGVA